MMVVMMEMQTTTTATATIYGRRQRRRITDSRKSAIDAACFPFSKPCEICIFIGCKKEIFPVYYIGAGEFSVRFIANRNEEDDKEEETNNTYNGEMIIMHKVSMKKESRPGQ